MKTSTKVAIVAGGYVVAFVVAAVVTRVYLAMTPAVDRQGAAGMTAFGDSLVFLATLGIAAVPATGALFYFLRSRRRLWVVLGVLAVTIAGSALIALGLTVLAPGAAPGSAQRSWSVMAPIRILVAPVLALFFLLAAIFAPARPARLCLLGATAIEVLSFVSALAIWLH